MNKQKLKKAFKFVGIKVLGAFIFVAVAGTSIWALAAFTEPTTTPGNSVQDWAKNIMGANNSDNAFDSSTVTANSDGSIVERLESLEAQVGATVLSSVSASSMSYASAAAYCRDLTATPEYAINGANTNTTYSDWRLGSMTELANFIGLSANTTFVWTATPRSYSTSGIYYALRFSDGYWSTINWNNGGNVRCVR